VLPAKLHWPQMNMRSYCIIKLPGDQYRR